MIIVSNNFSAIKVPYLLDNVSGERTSCLETDQRIAAILRGLAYSHTLNSILYVDEQFNETLVSILTQIHDIEYLSFFENIEHELKEGGILFDHRWIQKGVTVDTPFIKGMYKQALTSASAAYKASQYLLKGQPICYSVSRPPGHHAGTNFMGGYCYLNNAGVAVKVLENGGLGPVCLMDLDYHFGNGSEDIITNHTDSFFISLHANTLHQYPYIQTTTNHDRQLFYQFSKPPTVDDYLNRLDEALESISLWGCRSIVVSVGYDIIADDPHGHWFLPSSIFKEIGRRLKITNLPLCFIQEGGYNLKNLESGARYLIEGIES